MTAGPALWAIAEPGQLIPPTLFASLDRSRSFKRREYRPPFKAASTANRPPMTAGNLPCNRTEFGGRRWVVAGVGDGASLQLNRTNHNLRLAACRIGLSVEGRSELLEGRELPFHAACIRAIRLQL